MPHFDSNNWRYLLNELFLIFTESLNKRPFWSNVYFFKHDFYLMKPSKTFWNFISKTFWRHHYFLEKMVRHDQVSFSTIDEPSLRIEKSSTFCHDRCFFLKYKVKILNMSSRLLFFFSNAKSKSLWWLFQLSREIGFNISTYNFHKETPWIPLVLFSQFGCRS
jgi:hypothetical protein